MQDYPKGGIIGKTVHAVRAIQALQVPLYAANACYFIVLAVFPGLLLLLGLLRHTHLAVEPLAELFYGLLPEALAQSAEEWILLTYDNTSGAVMGISAVAALWSASRGVYGVLTGLNAIYGVSESRGYLRIRLSSLLYMFAFLLMLLLTLSLHMFRAQLALLLEWAASPGWRFLSRILNFRFLVLLGVQTIFFTVMFTVMPCGKNSVAQSIPGALLAALGWQIFSDLYSLYIDYSAHMGSVYGPVYAVALSMLWLYFCVSIVFYGGALNVLLKRRGNMTKQ